MKKILYTASLVLLIIAISTPAFAINKGVQILLKGKIFDEFTGKSMEINIEFKTESGKKFKIKSNSLDGSYEQIFNSGENVEIIFTNWNITRKINKLSIKDTTKYCEQHQNFYVKKYVQGNSVFSFNLFEPNSANLSADAPAKIDSLKDMLLFSRNIKIELRTNGHDTYKQTRTVQTPTKATKKKSKKPETTQEPIVIVKDPDMNALKDLVDRRTATLQNYIKDWSKYLERITVAGDYTAAADPNFSRLKAEIQLDYNYLVIITDLKNPLD